MDKESVKSLFFYGLYSLSSVSLVIFNKSIMHSFNNPHILLASQMMASVLLTILGTQAVEYFTLKKEKQGEDEDLEKGENSNSKKNTALLSIFQEYFRMTEWKLNHFLYCIPITVTFLAMLITSLKALARVTVPTVVVFRNIATIFIAAGDYLCFKRTISTKQMMSLVVIVLGASIYAYGDIHADALGYTWIGLNTLCVIINSLLEKYVVVNIQQTPVGVACYQNLLSASVLMIWIVCGIQQTNEITAPFSAYHKLMFGGSCIFGFTISVSYFSLQKFATPTSISVAGNMNKFLSVLVGAIVFQQMITLPALGGLIICVVGGLVYSLYG